MKVFQTLCSALLLFLPTDSADQPLLMAGSVVGSEQSKFIVTVKPLERVYHSEKMKGYLDIFKIAYSVQNTTKRAQSFKVWTGCWGWNWQTDNPLVLMRGQACTSNFPRRVVIESGKSLEGEIGIFVDEITRKGPLQFRIGFQALADNDIADGPGKKLGLFWSNKILIDVAD